MKTFILITAIFISSNIIGDDFSSLKKKIDDSNYCETDKECINLGAFCPIGCYIVVNEKEASKIKQELKSATPACVFKCWELQGISCKNKTCVAKVHKFFFDDK